jgi:transcriptional regulator with GAF, ATPase, and Fis domain
MGERGPQTTLIGIQDQPEALQLRSYALEVVGGPDAGRVFQGRKRSMLIGTHPSSDLALTDPHVSRLHARIDIEESEYLLSDLGSTNGTRVAGVRVRQACLEDGSEIHIGATRLAFRVLAEPFRIELSGDATFERLIGRSVPMRELFALLARVAPSDASVLIQGETGTGKELVAHAIHERSLRKGKPFVIFDCGAVPPTLIESELFGHERGAFTGAVAARAGVFERADGGTIFLDELGELALELQPKLLRALETGEIMRVGGERPIRVDVRVLTATHRDLARMVHEGGFRADLYYRLAVIRVPVPPLRERRDDIPLLASAFVKEILGDFGREGAAAKRSPLKIPQATLEAVFEGLRHHDWPGNVRELRNVVERAAILADPKLIHADALDAVTELTRSVEQSISKRVTLRAARAEHERAYLSDLLRAVENDLDEASRIAQVHRKSLERLIRKHKLRGGT